MLKVLCCKRGNYYYIFITNSDLYRPMLMRWIFCYFFISPVNTAHPWCISLLKTASFTGFSSYLLGKLNLTLDGRCKGECENNPCLFYQSFLHWSSKIGLIERSNNMFGKSLNQKSQKSVLKYSIGVLYKLFGIRTILSKRKYHTYPVL